MLLFVGSHLWQQDAVQHFHGSGCGYSGGWACSGEGLVLCMPVFIISLSPFLPPSSPPPLPPLSPPLPPLPLSLPPPPSPQVQNYPIYHLVKAQCERQEGNIEEALTSLQTAMSFITRSSAKSECPIVERVPYRTAEIDHVKSECPIGQQEFPIGSGQQE